MSKIFVIDTTVKKKDLSWEEKKVIIFLVSIIGTIAKPDIWRSFFVGKDFLELANKVRNDTIKLVDLLNIEDKVFDILTKDITNGTYQIECLHHTELQEYRRKQKKAQMQICKEDFDSLLEITLVKCKGCNLNAKRCGLRKVLKKIDIVAVDPEKTENKCEYYFK